MKSSCNRWWLEEKLITYSIGTSNNGSDHSITELADQKVSYIVLMNIMPTQGRFHILKTIVQKLRAKSRPISLLHNCMIYQKSNTLPTSHFIMQQSFYSTSNLATYVPHLCVPQFKALLLCVIFQPLTVPSIHTALVLAIVGAQLLQILNPEIIERKCGADEKRRFLVRALQIHSWEVTWGCCAAKTMEHPMQTISFNSNQNLLSLSCAPTYTWPLERPLAPQYPSFGPSRSNQWCMGLPIGKWQTITNE